MASFKGLCIAYAYQFLLSLHAQGFILSQLQLGDHITRVENATCPPGMIFLDMNRTDTASYCQCGNVPYAVDSNKRSESQPDLQHLYNHYDGISYCLQTSEGPRAYVKNSFWAGYYDNATEARGACHSAGELIVVLCPESFCDLARSSPTSGLGREIYPGFNADELFCASTHRTGLICSRCAPGYGAAINTLGNICADCRHGPPAGVTVFVWLLTEILPEVMLVIVFVIVDIPLLAGHMNAFLLYAHTFRAMNIYANRLLDPTFTSNPAMSLSYWIDWIYSLWSLNFIGSVPFFPPLCVSEEFTLLQKLSTQYVVAFLPFPILLAVYLLRLWYRKEPSRLCWGGLFRIMQRVHRCIARIQHACGKSSSSVRNGFASFLLLVYSKICFVSFYILATDTLSESCTVVFLDPYLKPFEREHLPPALLACFATALFVICPIVILIFYKPLDVRYRKRFALTSADSERQMKCKRRIERVAKFLDTFTIGFQSRYAFFGGLLFLYRAILWIIFANAPTPQRQYVFQIIVTAVLLVVHLICMPYKRKLNWLNRLDAVMYTNIILINGMSLYNIFLISNNLDESNTIYALQQICIMLPMLYPIIAVIMLVVKLWKKKKKNRTVTGHGFAGRSVMYGSFTSFAESQQDQLQTGSLKDGVAEHAQSKLSTRFERSELLSFTESSVDVQRSCSCCQVDLCCFSQRTKYECQSCLEGSSTSPVTTEQRRLLGESADLQPPKVTEVEIFANSDSYSSGK